MRRLAIAVVWLVTTTAALGVAHETRVGRVVIVLSPIHGVHTGDIAAFVVAWTWAFMLTVVLLRGPSLQRRWR